MGQTVCLRRKRGFSCHRGSRDTCNHAYAILDAASQCSRALTGFECPADSEPSYKPNIVPDGTPNASPFPTSHPRGHPACRADSRSLAPPAFLGQKSRPPRATCQIHKVPVSPKPRFSGRQPRRPECHASRNWRSGFFAQKRHLRQRTGDCLGRRRSAESRLSPPDRCPFLSSKLALKA